TSEGAMIISEALRNNNTLVKLFLSHNKLGDDGTKFLARALSYDNNSTLRELSLGHNGITDQGAEYLHYIWRKKWQHNMLQISL
ncbi:unnamed protein product, partial [Rotaria sp. Silwood1]